MPFAPGQSGNPAGRAPGTKPKAGRWKAAIRRALKEGDNLDACANALVTAAKAGDVPALKEIGDRTDGKVKQDSDVNLSGYVQLVKVNTGIDRG